MFLYIGFVHDTPVCVGQDRAKVKYYLEKYFSEYPSQIKRIFLSSLYSVAKF